jgi:hypothetical protein
VREKRAANLAAIGGAKSGKKQRKLTDLTEEEMPVSGGGSSSSGDEHTNTQLLFAELLKSQTNLARLESKKLGLAKEAARFYEGHLGLRDAYVEYLEWSQNREQKENQELKKKYQGVLDLITEHKGVRRGPARSA